MASDQRTRGLDKSTRATLSALDYALEQTDIASARRGDEFTSQEYFAGLLAKGEQIGQSGALYRLNGLVTSGKLKKRKIMINGATTNLYSKPWVIYQSASIAKKSQPESWRWLAMTKKHNKWSGAFVMTANIWSADLIYRLSKRCIWWRYGRLNLRDDWVFLFPLFYFKTQYSL